MSELKYTTIQNKKQYFHYASLLEDLVFSEFKKNETRSEVELLTALIEKWDAEHSSSGNVAANNE